MPSLPGWLRSRPQITRRALTIADMRMENVAKWSARAALAVVVCAFAISFAAIKWVAEENGIEPGWLAWLFPLVIDLPSLIASALTVALHDRKFHIRLYAWSVLLVFIALSWACNAVHALATMSEGKNGFVRLLADLLNIPANDPWLIGLVLLFALIPPVGVVLGVHLWAYALRHSAAADQRADGKPAKTSGKQQTAPKIDPGTERSGQQTKTAPETKPEPTKQKAAPAEEKTAPAVETTAPPARHAAPVAEPEIVPAAAETAPESAPAPVAIAPRSGPKRSGGPARTLIDFAWAKSDAEITAKPGSDWKVPAREMVRSIWESDPAAVNAAQIGRELGNPATEAPIRKLVKASVEELEAWPHWTTDAAEPVAEVYDQTADELDSEVDETAADSENVQVSEDPAGDDERDAIRAELHAADPPEDAEADAQVGTEASDREPVGVA
jgi:hypothetical protein